MIADSFISCIAYEWYQDNECNIDNVNFRTYEEKHS